MRIIIDGGNNSSSSPQPPVIGGRDKTAANGFLSYKLNGESRYYSLWVTKIEQAHQLNGDSSQGRSSNHFYAKSYSPSAYQVGIICSSQRDYQDLARFVRFHHEALINHVGEFSTHNRTAAATSPDFALLMKLYVPSEAISCYGWVDKFTLTREGFAVPAPEYTFPFAVVYDPHSADFHRSFIGRFFNHKAHHTPFPFTPQPTEDP